MRAPMLDALSAHLDALALQTGAQIVVWDPPSDTTHMLQFGEDAELAVFMPELRDVKDYFGALHEFGHLAMIRAGRMHGFDERPVDGRHLFDELAAWVWAFEHAVVPPTPEVVLEAESLIRGYMQEAGLRSEDPATWGAEHVPDDLREKYLSLAARFAELSGS